MEAFRRLQTDAYLAVMKVMCIQDPVMAPMARSWLYSCVLVLSVGVGKGAVLSVSQTGAEHQHRAARGNTRALG